MGWRSAPVPPQTAIHRSVLYDRRGVAFETGIDV